MTESNIATVIRERVEASLFRPEVVDLVTEQLVTIAARAMDAKAVALCLAAETSSGFYSYSDRYRLIFTAAFGPALADVTGVGSTSPATARARFGDIPGVTDAPSMNGEPPFTFRIVEPVVDIVADGTVADHDDDEDYNDDDDNDPDDDDDNDD